MAASDFFTRWAKPAGAEQAFGPFAVPAMDGPAMPGPDTIAPAAGTGILPTETRLPTVDDVVRLQTGSDFAPFMARGVDESVKRLALKKLFTDPRFNLMDGLDIYIGDYNTFVPMSAAMVASLNHGKALLDPLSHLLSPLQSPLQSLVAQVPPTADPSQLLPVPLPSSSAQRSPALPAFPAFPSVPAVPAPEGTPGSNGDDTDAPVDAAAGITAVIAHEAETVPNGLPVSIAIPRPNPLREHHDDALPGL